MKTTALELFEELGYKQTRYIGDGEEEILVFYNENQTNPSIVISVEFLLNGKDYQVLMLEKTSEDDDVPTYDIAPNLVMCIDMPLHKAIAKQLEELGWIGE